MVWALTITLFIVSVGHTILHIRKDKYIRELQLHREMLRVQLYRKELELKKLRRENYEENIKRKIN